MISIVIIKENPENLIKALKQQSYGITTMTVEGIKGNVKLVILIIKHKNLPKILNIIKNNNPNAFVSIENVQSMQGGNFPPREKTRWYLFRR